jgi:hypothetical protein
MSDFPALIHFYQGWALDPGKVSGDGLPIYVDTVMIQIEKPPLLKLNRAATKEDFTTYVDEYEVFKNQLKARGAVVADDGYPLVMWPVLSPADVETFAARKIYTVEQLAALAGNRNLPGNLAELALRAERLMDMQKNFGKYEALLTESNAQLSEATAQLNEARMTISAQNSLIDTLKMKVA